VFQTLAIFAYIVSVTSGSYLGLLHLGGNSIGMTKGVSDGPTRSKFLDEEVKRRSHSTKDSDLSNDDSGSAPSANEGSGLGVSVFGASQIGGLVGGSVGGKSSLFATPSAAGTSSAATPPATTAGAAASAKKTVSFTESTFGSGSTGSGFGGASSLFKWVGFTGWK
jgi:hypothetical protein